MPKIKKEEIKSKSKNLKNNPVAVKKAPAKKPLIKKTEPRRDSISISLNGKKVQCEAGENIWKVANRNGVQIPGLCAHPDFCAKGNCRVCVVEIKGRRTLQTSCSTHAEDGMEVITDSERVRRSRNLNLELIFAEHIEKCPTCIWRVNCRMLKYAEQYKIGIKRFHDRKSRRKIYKFANAVELDGTQCIDCRNCIDACAKLQKIDFLDLKGKGAGQEVIPKADGKHKCILCGQCAVHCPVSSAQEQADWDKVEWGLKHKRHIMVAQFAPSVRVTIGEEFGLEPGQVMTEKMVAGLKALGFDYVFDVNFSADATTMVEAEELLDRAENGGVLPMFTSCCPGWVNYVELYHPELIPNLTTSRSPHIHGGGIVKSYWANLKKIAPEKITVVSIMPCTAKKYEISRPEIGINGMKPVDFVLTTRELAWLFKKNGIDLPNIPPEKADSPLGEWSGASVIYGGSGGVMESALRTAQVLACGNMDAKICKTRIDFEAVRGPAGFKEAVVEVAGKKLRVGVVNGIGNIDIAPKHLKDFQYIEVMACPGGCIGGGGQPVPTTPEIRAKRVQALYAIDKKMKIRTAHENTGVIKALHWLADHHHLAHEVLHTRYKNKKKLKEL
jgi:iron-only hydrogenase group A